MEDLRGNRFFCVFISSKLHCPSNKKLRKESIPYVALFCLVLGVLAGLITSVAGCLTGLATKNSVRLIFPSAPTSTGSPGSVAVLPLIVITSTAVTSVWAGVNGGGGAGSLWEGLFYPAVFSFGSSTVCAMVAA